MDDIKKAEQEKQNAIDKADTRTGWQKFFGTGEKPKPTVGGFEQLIVNAETDQAKTPLDDFVKKYGTRPSISLRAQAQAQIGLIQETVKNLGLENLKDGTGKKYDFS